MTVEASHVSNHLASMPGLAHAVVTRKVAREIIQDCDGQMLLSGHLYEVYTTPAGAGLLRISTRFWHDRRRSNRPPLASALNRRPTANERDEKGGQ